MVYTKIIEISKLNKMKIMDKRRFELLREKLRQLAIAYTSPIAVCP